MARVTNVFIGGTTGNPVLYNGMDKNRIRPEREGIKQTAATKIRSENFGIASRASSTLQKGLVAVIPSAINPGMRNRFSGAIAKWLCVCDVDTLPPCDAAPYISDFRFAHDDVPGEFFRVPVTVSKPDDNLIMVGVNAFVPERNVTAPAGTVLIELVVAVAGCILKTGMPAGSSVQRIQVPYNQDEIAAQVLQFPVPIPAGSLTITAAWLQYYVIKKNGISRSESPAFMPAGVINARYM